MTYMSRGISPLLWLVILLSGGSDQGGGGKDGKDRKGVGWLLITPKVCTHMLLPHMVVNYLLLFLFLQS